MRRGVGSSEHPCDFENGAGLLETMQTCYNPQDNEHGTAGNREDEDQLQCIIYFPFCVREVTTYLFAVENNKCSNNHWTPLPTVGPINSLKLALDSGEGSSGLHMLASIGQIGPRGETFYSCTSLSDALKEPSKSL